MSGIDTKWDYKANCIRNYHLKLRDKSGSNWDWTKRTIPNESHNLNFQQNRFAQWFSNGQETNFLVVYGDDIECVRTDAWMTIEGEKNENKNKKAF